MHDKNKKVIDRLISEQKVPKEGLFDITEQHLIAYMETYNAKFGSAGNKLGSTSNMKYARKIAGLTFLQLKIERGGSPATCKEGLVYLITNPAWPDHIKIGMAFDLNKRLSAYQTYDPFRQYEVKHYDFVFDRRAAERKILAQYALNIEQGEWVKNLDGRKIVSELAHEYSSTKQILKRKHTNGKAQAHVNKHSRIVRPGTISKMAGITK